MEIKRFLGIPFRIYPTKTGSWKGYCRFAGERKFWHKATRTALEEAFQEHAERMAGARPEAIEMNRLEWQEYRKAVTVLEPYGMTVLEAAEQMAKQKSRIKKDITIDEVAKDYVSAKKQDDLSEKYIATLEYHFRLLREKFGNALMRTIGTRDLEEWIRGLTISGRTRNNVRTNLISLWKHAHHQEWLDADSVMIPTRLKKAKQTEEEVEVISPQMLKELVSQLTIKEKTFVSLACFCGMRTFEIIRMEWTDWIQEEMLIEVAKSKGRVASRRLVPIPKNVLAVLKKANKTQKVSHLDVQQDISEKAKKLWGRWYKNAFRHSAISYKLALTGDIARTATESGNSPQKIITNYRALRTVDGKTVTKELAQEWFKIALI